MRDILVYSAGFACIALLVFVGARIFDRRLAFGSCVLAALYLGLDDLATASGPRFDPFGGDWNWSGKVFSLALAVAAILALRLDRRAIGLQLPRSRTRSATLLTALLLAASVALGLWFEPGKPSAETLAFQATMPALAEELAYRGIAPALLLGLAHGRQPPPGIPWAAVAATALMFGAWHGLSYGDGAFSFEPVPALYTFAGGIAYGWMRFATGSLVFPVLAHALGNLLFQLSFLLRA